MKLLRQMEIFKDTNLPEDGWMQGCFICYGPTARLVEAGLTENENECKNEFYITEYLVYLCHTCKDFIDRSKPIREEYEESILAYIENIQ